jgi:hypothetical protein
MNFLEDSKPIQKWLKLNEEDSSEFDRSIDFGSYLICLGEDSYFNNLRNKYKEIDHLFTEICQLHQNAVAYTTTLSNTTIIFNIIKHIKQRQNFDNFKINNEYSNILNQIENLLTILANKIEEVENLEEIELKDSSTTILDISADTTDHVIINDHISIVPYEQIYNTADDDSVMDRRIALHKAAGTYIGPLKSTETIKEELTQNKEETIKEKVIDSGSNTCIPSKLQKHIINPLSRLTHEQRDSLLKLFFEEAKVHAENTLHITKNDSTYWDIVGEDADRRLNLWIEFQRAKKK